jgi:hypothetical protein
MKPFLGARAEIVPGRPTVVECDAHGHPYGVVFEDEGETGYFYARVRGVQGPDIPSALRIVWSQDWTKAALVINDRPHAMFDFSEKVGYSIDQYPEPDPRTGWKHAPWDRQLKRYFYESNSTDS